MVLGTGTQNWLFGMLITFVVDGYRVRRMNLEDTNGGTFELGVEIPCNSYDEMVEKVWKSIRAGYRNH